MNPKRTRRAFIKGTFGTLALVGNLPAVSQLSAAPTSSQEADIKQLGVDPLHDRYRFGRRLYQNSLRSEYDVQDWRLEGEARISFENGAMLMRNRVGPEHLQAANWNLWCPMVLPSNISIQYKFRPLNDLGLAAIYFAITGKQGEDAFDHQLPPRNGHYDQYTRGSLQNAQLQYYRRYQESERDLELIRLYKSYGPEQYESVASGADPIPLPTDRRRRWYTIQIVKCENEYAVFVENLKVLHWIDDGVAHGPQFGGGRICFRHMAPLAAEYADLVIQEATLVGYQAERI